MSIPAGSEEVLLDNSWRRLPGGSYHAAWHKFWGKDLDLTVLPPWKAWDNALTGPSESSTAEGSLHELAQIVFGDETPVALPPCTYLDSPWVDILPATKGRIMVAEGYNHIYGRIKDFHNDTRSPGVIVEGQSGIGKTYLSLYLLVLHLSSERPVLYSPHARHYVFFHAGGVLESDKLELSWFNNRIFRQALPKRTWIILDVRADESEPLHAATAGHLYPVMLCRPEEKYFYSWKMKKLPSMLLLDLPSPATVLAGALIQVGMRNRKEHLVRLLSVIRDFGPCSRLCYLGTTRHLDLHASLRTYVSELSPTRMQRFPVLAVRGYDFPDLLRSDDGPDIFALRRDYHDVSTEEFIPVFASRYVMSELQRQSAFTDLYNLREMEVVREPPDDMEHSRLWLFEYLCHALLSEGGKPDATFAKLTPCFAEIGDKLLLEHVFRPRSIHTLETDPPRGASPEAYFVVRDLRDATFHSISFLTPYSKRALPVVGPQTDRALTRGLARQLASSTQTQGSAPTRVTRSTRRAREPIPEALARPSIRRPRLKAERRFVVVYQMLLDRRPTLTTLGLEYLDSIRNTDSYAQYFFVFVTIRGQGLDLDSFTEALIARFKWYHLEVDLDFT
ncbi:unnamed protein product [Peniophora sp. CBMAI 1063]|nr:unnamed protein product [Peniophora sp. CBMAI 1063]